MKKNWIFISLILIVALVIVFIVTQTKKKQDETLIGVVLPLTGDAAIYGETHKNGIEIAIEEINKTGYIDGSKIRAIYEDSQADPKTSVSAIMKLINIDKVSAIIGDMFSASTLAMAPIAEKSKIVLLSPTSAAEAVPNAGEYIFSIYPTDVLDGKFIANAALNMKFKTAAILYVQADAMINAKNSFRKVFEEKGGSVFLEEGFAPKEKDFRQILQKCKQRNPEIIFIPAYLAEISEILKQSKELGLKSRFITISTAYDEKLFELVGNAAEGLMFSVPFFDTTLEVPEIINFRKHYRERFDKDPDIWAAYGYDAIKIISLGIQNSRINNSLIKDELLKIRNFPGVTGKTSFLGNGSVEKPLRMMEVKDNKFLPLQ